MYIYMYMYRYDKLSTSPSLRCRLVPFRRYEVITSVVAPTAQAAQAWDGDCQGRGLPLGDECWFIFGLYG